MSKTIGIIGSGMVGKALARGFGRYGYDAMIASRSPQTQEALRAEFGDTVQVGDFVAAAAHGEIIVLAVKGEIAVDALTQCGIENLIGKTVIDANNPIEQAPPENGVLRFFTAQNDSLMEQLQREFPEVNFVKAFSCVGNAHMVDPDFGDAQPTMFICGNNEAAKHEVVAILDDFGWDVADMGAVEAARAIEPLCILWCIPAFTGGGSDHAFKLLHR